MFQLFIYRLYDASPSLSLGWDLIFVHWRKKTHLCRFSVHWRKKTHLRKFSTGVYKEGSFNSWCGRIFHSAQSYFTFQVFFIEKPLSLGQSTRRQQLSYHGEFVFLYLFQNSLMTLSYFIMTYLLGQFFILFGSSIISMDIQKGTITNLLGQFFICLSISIISTCRRPQIN